MSLPHQYTQYHKTGLFLELIDFHRLFERYSSEAIFVNHFNLNNEDDLEKLNQHLYSFYEGDTFDTMPSCECGALQGEYNVDRRCKECQTLVTTATEQPIRPKLWIQVPEGVEGFISPQVLIILRNLFNTPNLSIIEWLINRHHQLPAKLNQTEQNLVNAFKQIRWKSGLNEFIHRFDEAIETLIPTFYSKREAYAQHIYTFIQENRQLFFPSLLPIPNKALFIFEKTPMFSDGSRPINYVDEYLWSAPDAVMTICSLNTYTDPPQSTKEHVSAKTIIQLSNFYENYMENRIGSKPGFIRKQILGSRFDFSARAVIASLSRTHSYEELHIPWGVALHIFKLHITNKLMRRSFTPDEVEALIYRHTKERVYVPQNPKIIQEKELLDSLIDEIIGESPYEISFEAVEVDEYGQKHWQTYRKHGFPCLLNRNPTLLRGSVQLFYITHVIKDPAITAIKMPTLTLRSPNADEKLLMMNQKRLREVAMG